MGYRFYVGKISKTFADEIKSCHDEASYAETVKRHLQPLAEEEIKNGVPDKYGSVQYVLRGIQPDGDGHSYIPPYHISEQLHEFGKECPAVEDIYDKNAAVKKFFSEELDEAYEEYGAVIINEEIFLKIINGYQQNIISYYKKILDSNFKDPYYPQRTREEAALKCVDDHLFWWEKFGALNLDKDDPNICNSWMYDHAIFELVRIYKTFDWENDVMLFYGY